MTMTEVKELRIPHADLTIVSIECKRGDTETVVDLADNRQRKAWDDHERPTNFMIDPAVTRRPTSLFGSTCITSALWALP